LGKGFNGQLNVLFALEPIYAEYELLAVERRWGSLFEVVDARVHAGIYDFRGDLGLERRPGALDYGPCKVGIDGHGVSIPHAPFLQAVKRQTVEALQCRLAAPDEQQVGKVAVEQDGDARREGAHQGEAGGELVDDKGAGVEGGQLARQMDGEQEVDVAEDGAQNGQPREDGRRDERVAADANVEGS
jgi:hypothetical protein